jgi:hypothetical protein
MPQEVAGRGKGRHSCGEQQTARDGTRRNHQATPGALALLPAAELLANWDADSHLTTT